MMLPMHIGRMRRPREKAPQDDLVGEAAWAGSKHFPNIPSPMGGFRGAWPCLRMFMPEKETKAHCGSENLWVFLWVN